MILGMGVPELLVILVVVLLIFGPKNLPKIGSALGKTVKNVREGMEGDEKSEAKADDATDDDATELVVDEDDADADDDSNDDSKFCGHCGAKNPAGNAFCCKCGEKLD